MESSDGDEGPQAISKARAAKNRVAIFMFNWFSEEGVS